MLRKQQKHVILAGWHILAELITHSKPESISVSVHYGGERSNDPEVIAEPDVVLTTYGVLTAAYKSDPNNSIFRRVDWHRVVLDEAHIKPHRKPSRCLHVAGGVSLVHLFRIAWKTSIVYYAFYMLSHGATGHGGTS